VVTRNAARLSVMPKTRPTVERESLTVGKARRLLAAAEGHRLEALIVVGLTCGLRPGELAGLQWSDLSLNRKGPTLTVSGSMKVERTRDEGGRRLYRSAVKRSRARQRTAALAPVAVAALKAHKRRQAEERLELGDIWTDHGLVFPSAVGTPSDPANIRHTFTRVANKILGESQRDTDHWRSAIFHPRDDHLE
jgi:integrase